MTVAKILTSLSGGRRSDDATLEMTQPSDHRHAAGAMSTIDTETGFPDLIAITAARGRGGLVEKAGVTPDRYLVFKPFLDDQALTPIVGRVAERRACVLTDPEILALARRGVATERRHGRPMDVEWARDGASGELSVVQARPAPERAEVDVEDAPATRTRLMIDAADSNTALRSWRLPCGGVGLVRIEDIVSTVIRVHPMALARFDDLTDDGARTRIAELTAGYADRTAYFVEGLAREIATIAASRYLDPVLVRTSDFRSSERTRLIGGAQFEPHEENPMLGWRGASRYYDEGYRDGYALECRALRHVREEMGFRNVIVMIPFCRTPGEADSVLAEMARHGLERGREGLQVYVMAEIPSNILEADEFARRFDGFSIGSTDLTQLALGVDRGSARLARLFDERSPTVRKLIRMLIASAHAAGRPVGICGQAPSDRPDFVRFLVQAGIDSISVNPDDVLEVSRQVAEAERTDPRAGLSGLPGGRGGFTPLPPDPIHRASTATVPGAGDADTSPWSGPRRR